MVIGEKLYSGNFSGGNTTGGGGGIPKSPSFHSSLELAEATGRQIVSPENCNYFTFSSNMSSTPNSDEKNTANNHDKPITNGFVAKTIQNFTKFQNMTNNCVDNENNDTQPSLSIKNVESSDSSNSVNDNNGPNRINNTLNHYARMKQMTNNISTDNNKGLLKPGNVVNGGGSPSRARDRNNLNGGVYPNSMVNGGVANALPLIKGL